MAEAIFLTRWKEDMYRLIKLRFKDHELSREKTMRYLDTLITENINNIKIALLNNYTNRIVRSDVLSLIDLIETNKLIIGGGGVIYYPHSVRPNILIDFIRHIMKQRKFWKNERRKYKKYSDEWMHCDRQQLSFKLIINSLRQK